MEALFSVIMSVRLYVCRYLCCVRMGFLGGSDGKESAAMQETWVPPLGWEDPLEEGTATHFNPHGRGAWQTTVHTVAKSRTQQKQLCELELACMRAHAPVFLPGDFHTQRLQFLGSQKVRHNF